MRALRRLQLAGIVSIIAGTLTCAFGNVTNSIPFQRSFEQAPYSNGAVIVDMNGVGVDGWYGTPGATADQAVAVFETFSYAGTPPITDDTHTVVLSFTTPQYPAGGILNRFTTNQYGDINNLLTNVTIDCLMQAGYLDTVPRVAEDAQMAVFVTNSGHLVVRHSVYDSGFASTKLWTELEHPPLGSNEWFRLTITMDYLTSGDNFGNNLWEYEHFFQISLNGGPPISNALAYKSPVIGSDPLSDMGGTWFKCANADAFVKTPAYFSALGLNGKGMIDDLVISAAVRPKTPMEEWLDDLGLGSPWGDDDGDGCLNYQEFYAGTDPRSPDSAFKAIVLGTNFIKWYAATNWAMYGDPRSASPLYIYKSTNLTSAGGGWVGPISTNPRSPDGTNIWWYDVRSSDSRAVFYDARIE